MHFMLDLLAYLHGLILVFAIFLKQLIGIQINFAS